MHLNNVRTRLNEPKELGKLLLHLAAPILIIHVQGDDGTAIIYAIIGCCMMFAAGLSWKYILGAVSAAAVAMATAFAFFSDKIGKGYQWYRILAVIDPDNKTGWAPSETIWKNIIYQQQRGEIALGSGGIFGNGLFGGSYYSVPNAHNDFILSWIGNAAGFVGCCVVLGVLFALVIKTFLTGARSEDLLGTFICAGIGGALLAQIAVNVGMNLRVLPVIGVTLPFYSAGGSSVLMLYICVGLVLSVYTHNTKSCSAEPEQKAAPERRKNSPGPLLCVSQRCCAACWQAVSADLLPCKPAGIPHPAHCPPKQGCSECSENAGQENGQGSVCRTLW